MVDRTVAAAVARARIRLEWWGFFDLSPTTGSRGAWWRRGRVKGRACAPSRRAVVAVSRFESGERATHDSTGHNPAPSGGWGARSQPGSKRLRGDRRAVRARTRGLPRASPPPRRAESHRPLTSLAQRGRVTAHVRARVRRRVVPGGPRARSRNCTEAPAVGAVRVRVALPRPHRHRDRVPAHLLVLPLAAELRPLGGTRLRRSSGRENYTEALLRDERFLGSVWNTVVLIVPSLVVRAAAWASASPSS